MISSSVHQSLFVHCSPLLYSLGCFTTEERGPTRETFTSSADSLVGIPPFHFISFPYVRLGGWIWMLDNQWGLDIGFRSSLERLCTLVNWKDLPSTGSVLYTFLSIHFSWLLARLSWPRLYFSNKGSEFYGCWEISDRNLNVYFVMRNVWNVIVTRFRSWEFLCTFQGSFFFINFPSFSVAK